MTTITLDSNARALLANLLVKSKEQGVQDLAEIVLAKSRPELDQRQASLAITVLSAAGDPVAERLAMAIQGAIDDSMKPQLRMAFPVSTTLTTASVEGQRKEQ